MNKIKFKYAPMIIVIYFVIIGLIITLLISTIKYFLDDTPFLQGISTSIFVSVAAIFIGLIYCEISYWIKSLWFGSILFGALSINLFIFLLPISTLLLEENIGELPPLDLYFGLIVLGAPLLGLIYFGIKKKIT